MNPLIPMFAITGRPTGDQLRARLQRFYEGGVRQIMLYPRAGCDVPYMSEEWRGLCAACIDFAKERGMTIWLYDEFNWPSGSCKGEVALDHPEFMASRFVWDGESVRVLRASEEDVRHTYEQFTVDMLNPDAVDRFIALTHERYARWFGELFGTVIRGIFTDEPSFAYTCRGDNQLPYYDGIETDYRARFGEDMTSGLIAYFTRGECAAFSERFWRLIAERFRACYFDRISAWCRAHNLLMTGHCMCDDCVQSEYRFSGSVMDNLDRFDVPGVDEINTWLDAPRDYLFAQIQNVRAHGAPHAMAELFALGPCSMPYARMRQMIWTAAAHGVDHFFMAISHLDARGNWKKDNFFHDFAPESPDFAGAAALGQTAEAAARFAARAPLTHSDVALRLPVSAALSTIRTETPDRVDRAVNALIDALRARQIQWTLIREAEKTPAPHTIAFDANGTYTDETTGARYTDAAACADDLLRQIERRVWVTRTDGSPEENVLLKTYSDGAFVVIDRAMEPAAPRALVLHRGDQSLPFTLETFGVFTSEDAPHTAAAHSLPIEGYAARSAHPALLRLPLLDAPECAFTLEEPLTMAFNGRVYPEEGEILLDGAPLDFSRPAANLTACFGGLYRRTEPIKLSAGRHVVSSLLTDKCFLPVVIAEGAFSVDGALTVRPRAENDASFTHSAEAVFDADIPEGARRIALCYDDNLLVASLTVNGQPAGTRAFAPYRFELPDDLAGRKARFVLTAYSSHAPLFGPLDRHDGTWGNRVSRPERLSLPNLRLEWD